MLNDIKNGLGLAKGVVDLAKNIKDLSDSTDNLELKEAAADLRSQTIDLKDTVSDMRETIRELEEKLSFKEKLKWNGKTFEYQKGDKKVYVCNGCEPKGIISHMTESFGLAGGDRVDCPVCDNKVWIQIRSGQIERVSMNRRSKYKDF